MNIIQEKRKKLQKVYSVYENGTNGKQFVDHKPILNGSDVYEPFKGPWFLLSETGSHCKV